MITSILMSTLLTAPVANATIPAPFLFCNVTEFVGSSFDKNKQVDSTNEKYGKLQTRVWYIDDLKKGINVGGVLLKNMNIELSTHDAISRDSNKKDVQLLAIIAKITDTNSGLTSSGRSNFIKNSQGEVSGLYSLVNLTEPNFDKVEISCAKAY